MSDGDAVEGDTISWLDTSRTRSPMSIAVLAVTSTAIDIARDWLLVSVGDRRSIRSKILPCHAVSAMSLRLEVRLALHTGWHRQEVKVGHLLQYAGRS